MSFEQIKEAREQVRGKLAKLNKRENTDDVLELTLEELTAISGGVIGKHQELAINCPCICKCNNACGCEGCGVIA